MKQDLRTTAGRRTEILAECKDGRISFFWLTGNPLRQSVAMKMVKSKELILENLDGMMYKVTINKKGGK